ncbi:hypothetical protein P7C70_g1984, partial [Phenoliferia sp. Uapishka_3]
MHFTHSFIAAFTTLATFASLASASSEQHQVVGRRHHSRSSNVVERSGFTGTASFFDQDGGTGACGTAHGDYDLIVALASGLYDTNSHCGDSVTITNTANSKSVTAVVADRCIGCQSRDTYALDLSLGTFDAIGDQATGILDISWSYNRLRIRCTAKTQRYGMSIIIKSDLDLQAKSPTIAAATMKPTAATKAPPEHTTPFPSLCLEEADVRIQGITTAATPAPAKLVASDAPCETPLPTALTRDLTPVTKEVTPTEAISSFKHKLNSEKAETSLTRDATPSDIDATPSDTPSDTLATPSETLATPADTLFTPAAIPSEALATPFEIASPAASNQRGSRQEITKRAEAGSDEGAPLNKSCEITGAAKNMTPTAERMRRGSIVMFGWEQKV